MDDPLELENRKRIFEYVRHSPGLHFRELQRQTNMPIGVLNYHLDYLVKRELLTQVKEGGFSRYYPRDQISADKRRIMACLRQEIPRGIILYLLRSPGATHGALLENFAISGGTLSYHIKKLTVAGVLTLQKSGRESHLTVVSPETVTDLLIVYRRTFLDRLVDEFVARYIESGGTSTPSPEPGVSPEKE